MFLQNSLPWKKRVLCNLKTNGMTVNLKRDIRAEENVRPIKLWACKRGLQNECISLPAVTAQGPGRWIHQPEAELCWRAGRGPLLWLSPLIIPWDMES